jgi:hypothetical protein
LLGLLSACARAPLSGTPGSGGRGGGGGADATPFDAGVDVTASNDAADAMTADGGIDAGRPRWRDGTRLRARAFRAVEPGTSVFSGLYDSGLNGECAFLPTASDGTFRCIPFVAAEMFLDPACTMPIMEHSATCTPPSHVSVPRGGSSCAPRYDGFKVGPPQTRLRAAKVWSHAGGRCQESFNLHYDQYFPLTPETDASFVAGVEVREDRGGGVAMRWWQAEDGGRFPIGAWDVQREAPCEPGPGMYADRCVPVEDHVFTTSAADRIEVVHQYSDAACSEAAFWARASCGAPLGEVEQPDGCGFTAFSALVGTEKLDPYFYRIPSEGCVPSAGGSSFLRGATPLDPSAFPRLATSFEGSGRLKAYSYASVAGQPLSLAPRAYDDSRFRSLILYDSLRREACAPKLTPHGTRCIPVRARRFTYCTDMSCSQPLYAELTNSPEGICAARRPAMYYPPSSPPVACPSLPSVRTYDVGAPFSATTIHNLSPFGGEVDAAPFRLFTLSPSTETSYAELAFD